MWFVGDDWAEDHHDVEVQDGTGRRLARARLPEGVAGIARLHELIAGVVAEEAEPGQVSIGIETDRGPWVAALVAAGYGVFAINPRQVARYRERHGTSGAKSDAADAHTLAVKVRTRAHQNLIWDRHRQMLRLRAALREFFPAALEAFPDLTAPDALELLAAAPDPDRAARLSRSKIAAALRRARRRDVEAKAGEVQAALRSAQLTQPAELAGAYAATVRASVALIAAITTQITALGKHVEAHFGRHPDAEIYRSQPGLGDLLGARVLGEFGDDPDRYAGARARKNYAGQAPITRASGKKRVVLARSVRNRRLADALHQQASCALRASPGARAYDDFLRARGAGHHAALRQLANRLVGILHGCLKTHTVYDETTAWAHHNQDHRSAA